MPDALLSTSHNALPVELKREPGGLSPVSPAVRDVLLRLPPPTLSAGMLGAVISDMDARLRGSDGSQ